jgi:glycosyltransferase 2 family protein
MDSADSPFTTGHGRPARPTMSSEDSAEPSEPDHTESAGFSAVNEEPPPDPQDAARQKRQRFWLGLISGMVLVALGGLAIHHISQRVVLADVWNYLRDLPAARVLEGIGFTAAAYLLLSLYDVSALRFLKMKVKYRLVALASFAGYAMSNNIGWAVLSGVSVRYRVYSTVGLSMLDVAKVVVFSTTTFTLGVLFMGGLGLLFGPHPASQLLGIPEWVLQTLAILTLISLFALCVVAEIKRQPLRFFRWSLSLPSSGMVVAQIFIASMEILLTGAVLWQLLPPMHNVSYVEFMSIYCAALAVAIISHVPGGIGVFEAIVLLGLSAQGATLIRPAVEGATTESVILGALLAYRFIYYVVPLAVAGVLLGSFELAKYRAAAKSALLQRGQQGTGNGPPP